MPERANKKPHPFWRKILSLPLRFKITIPYLILASLLAGMVTFQVSRTFLITLEERFQSQLADAAARAADEVVNLEETHLTALRAIAFTQGVPEAIAARDAAALRALVYPQALNNQLYFVEVLDAAGKPLLSLHSPQPAQVDYTGELYPEVGGWAISQRVLQRQVDALGDKYSEIVKTGWGTTLYTAGPVTVNDQLHGVVLVGTPVDILLPLLGRSSIADISLYNPQGSLAATTLPSGSIGGLGAEEMSLLPAAGESLPSRTIDISGRSYLEALDGFYLRGVPSGWFLGVSLPQNLVGSQPGWTWAQLISIFVVGLLALIGMGVLVAQLIAIPVFRLVRATRQVSSGELDVRVDVFSDDELGYLTRGFNQMVGELRSREKVRELFGRMVSEDVREAVLAGKIELGGEVREVTVLFTDLRGFTSMSEEVSPQDMISTLNEFFHVVGVATKRHKGMINQFGGDSALVIFGAPIPRDQAENLRHAIQAAIDIRLGVAVLNARRISENKQALRFGVGINSGSVVAGNLGSEERFSYTVIGDVVNVAARLQGLSRSFPASPMLVAADCIEPHRAVLDVEFMRLGEFELKGKSQPVSILTIYGPKTTGLPEFEVLEELGYPKVNALIACYLHCLGHSVQVIAETLEVERVLVRNWLTIGHTRADTVTEILVNQFNLPAQVARRMYADLPFKPVLAARIPTIVTY